MGNKKRKPNYAPDYNDPFGPPKVVRPVRCLHCNEVYPSSEIKWSPMDDIWVCKNYERCGGKGYGFDIDDDGPMTLENIFGTAEKLIEVFCCQCGETYPATAMGWDAIEKRPTCKNAPKCQGVGFGDMCNASSPYLGGEIG